MSKKKTTADWANDLENLGGAVNRQSFQPPGTSFLTTLQPTGQGGSRVLVSATTSRKDATQMVFWVPTALKERLEAATVGSVATGVNGILEWFLNYAESSGQALEVKNLPKDP